MNQTTRTPYDQVVKRLLRAFLTGRGIVVPEYSVQAEEQAVDLLFEPLPDQDFIDERGILGRIFHQERTLVEAFHEPPDLHEWLSCVYKQMTLFHAMKPDERRLPTLYVLSAGKPDFLMQQLQLSPMPGFPRGFYQLRPVLRVRLVVINEVPKGRETLLLRLLGAGAVLRGALKELNRLPEEAWEWDVVGNILLALREYHAYHPHQEGHMSEFDTIVDRIERDIQHRLSQGRQEGRQEGQEGGVAAAQEILRTLLRMRFGEVAPDLDAALSAVRDLQQLQLLTPTIAAGTTDAIREALTERQ